MTDRMSQVALTASGLATAMGIELAHASVMENGRDVRAHHLAKAFQQYRGFLRAMTELERVAPNAAAAGYAEDDKIHDFIEAKVA